MSQRCCLCRCHQDKIADNAEAQNRTGYSVPEPELVGYKVHDPIEAFISCKGCEVHHIGGFLNMDIWNDRYIPDPLAWTAREK